MCLESKVRLPRIAREDMECYKVLLKCGCKLYRTPVVRYLINKNTIIGYKLKGKFTECITSILLNFTYGFHKEATYQISSGFIHTYTSMKYIRIVDRDIMKVFKCRIPKGSLYYTDILGKEYASSSIIFIEKIK